ncbi:patatin-like phospholipase family protein [Nocardioides sp. KIGAM211]|uniref:Patatin-like phospholipase family protein n=1 Tax=Nocardioides luti TaxID=2761101 RepID=A0A7X0VAC6_9ACTN|nr:patatin-like phospholipase family protein [Nocardioides luti]MBB6627195.1 patatin-like phospholipase family protein [Nocardioides luti]
MSEAGASGSSGRRGVVLGGGGVTGIAWMTGMLAGLLEEGVDLSGADLVVGTSAGSAVGAQLTTGLDLPELLERQLAPVEPGAPYAVLGTRVLLGFGWAMLRSRGDLEGFGRRLGQWSVDRAAAGKLPSLEERYAAIRSRLPVQEWPAPGRLVVTAVDADTGELRTFDGSDDVPLVDAVAASCAVPGVYPPVPIGGRRYVDGGARSTANADLAASCAKVVALTPIPRAAGPMKSAQAQLGGKPSVIIAPDEGARAAIGKNVLDPAARPGSAREGLRQGRAAAAEVGGLWG